MNKAEDLIKIALDGIPGELPNDTKKNVLELLSGGEPGVALEVLCSQLVEFEVSVSAHVRDLLVESANSMGIEVDEIKDLTVL